MHIFYQRIPLPGTKLCSHTPYSMKMLLKYYQHQYPLFLINLPTEYHSRTGFLYSCNLLAQYHTSLIISSIYLIPPVYLLHNLLRNPKWLEFYFGWKEISFSYQSTDNLECNFLMFQSSFYGQTCLDISPKIEEGLNFYFFIQLVFY